MGVRTTVAGLSYATNHVVAASKSGQDVNSLNHSILVRAAELTRDLQVLLGSMQTGDPNITTINAQITALS